MTSLQDRFERAISNVLATTPDPSPELIAYIACLRAHAQLAAQRYATGSDADFEAWKQSVEDDSAWRALSPDEHRLFLDQQ